MEADYAATEDFHVFGVEPFDGTWESVAADRVVIHMVPYYSWILLD